MIGLAAATFVKNLVGTGAPHFGIGGTDLGMSAWLPNGEIAHVFGDSFEEPGLPDRSPGWRGLTLLRSGVIDPGVFISAAGGKYAKELLEYEHQAPYAGEVTRIPNDIFVIGKRVWLSYFSVNNWEHGTWETNYARLAYSDDNGENWTDSNCVWQNNKNHTDTYQMQSWVVDGEVAYLFSTSNGRHLFDGLHVSRVDVRKITDRSAYQTWGFKRTLWWWPWTGTWGWNNPITPVITGIICEPSVRKIENMYVFSTLDLFRRAIVTRIADAPDLPWTAPKIQVSSNDYPSIYGGFIGADSTLDQLWLDISQWTKEDYKVMRFKGSA